MGCVSTTIHIGKVDSSPLNEGQVEKSERRKEIFTVCITMYDCNIIGVGNSHLA
jgi:hypothetical protein